ncbi:MAG: FAD-binding protein [Polyangiaceae bacterium]
MDLAAALQHAAPGVRTSASSPDRIAYARDLWPRHHLAVSAGRIAEHRPALVAWPSNTDEVAQVVAFCAAEGVPLVPFGAGSGVCGGVLPDARTVVLDLKRMSRWRHLDAQGPTLEVESGALGITLEEMLADRGLTLGHFPSSILCSTVGGWVAARSAGQCSGRYGKMEDMVASLECVVGRGEVVRFERRLHGPDATPLIIGSEGVLGVVTSARLRLHALAPERAFGAFSFADMEAGWTALREMFQAGLRPAVARLYDPFDSMMARMGAGRRARRAEAGAPASEASSNDKPKARGLFPGAGALALRSALRVPRLVNRIVDAVGGRPGSRSTLVLIFEGSPGEAQADMAAATAISARLGAEALGEEPARHWLAHRYSVSYRQAPVFMAGAFSDTMEVAAPWSRLGELYRAVRAALGRHVFVMAHLSHAYPDGCSIYFTFAGSAPSVPEAEARYDAAWRAAMDAAIGAGGTLSHHHGVGRSKAPKLGAELGLGVEAVHALRGVLDPAPIMNPGNLLPRQPPVRRAAPPPPAAPELDPASQLVHASGTATLASVQRAAAISGLDLGIDPGATDAEHTTVAAWIAAGTPGAPDAWLDPVDHLVAGFQARLPGGAELSVRTSPRRAVGPDLLALFHGAAERVGTITAAHLRVHGRQRPRGMPVSFDRDPPPTPGEAHWLERIHRAVAALR